MRPASLPALNVEGTEQAPGFGRSDEWPCPSLMKRREQNPAYATASVSPLLVMVLLSRIIGAQASGQHPKGQRLSVKTRRRRVFIRTNNPPSANLPHIYGIVYTDSIRKKLITA